MRVECDNAQDSVSQPELRRLTAPRDGVSQKELRTASSHKRNCELRRLTKGSAALKCASHKTKCSTNCVSHKTNFSELASHKKNLIEMASLHKRKSSNSASLTNELLSKGNHRIFENRIQEESKHLFVKMWYNNRKIWEAGRISKESGLRTSFSRIWPRKVASSKRGKNNQKAVSYTSKSSLLSLRAFILDSHTIPTT